MFCSFIRILRLFSSNNGPCPNCRSAVSLDALQAVYVEPAEPSKQVRDLKAQVERERKRANENEIKLKSLMRDSDSPSSGDENSGDLESTEDEVFSEDDSENGQEDSEAEEDEGNTDEAEDDKGDANDVNQNRYEHENGCCIF